MPRAPKEGTVSFPLALWRIIEGIAANRYIPIETLIVSEMARWCQEHQAEIVRTVTVELPEDVERAKGNASGFVGVYPHGNRWKATYRQSVIGVFATPEDAALARYKEQHAELDANTSKVAGLIAPSDPARRFQCPCCRDEVTSTSETEKVCPKCFPCPGCTELVAPWRKACLACGVTIEDDGQNGVNLAR
jgi:hypothetical protein